MSESRKPKAIIRRSIETIDRHIARGEGAEQIAKEFLSKKRAASESQKRIDEMRKSIRNR